METGRPAKLIKLTIMSKPTNACLGKIHVPDYEHVSESLGTAKKKTEKDQNGGRRYVQTPNVI